MKYCRGESTTKLLNSTGNGDCMNGGEQLLFDYLAKQNISPNEVLSWSSGVERADDYAHFYYNNQWNFNGEFLCNCTQPGTFGSNCEYELLHDAITFEEAIKSQFKQKQEDRWGMQRYGNISCYIPVFECDYGLLCLDWRNICDGEQQCINGTDEENCDLLEFNECEDDEYRCENGMCITEEYWIDGDRDCMDASDEREIMYSGFCSYIPGYIECEERICLRQLWSCGDGECIRGSSRLGFTGDTIEYCESMREFNYMCEIHPEELLWTQPNGLCWNLDGYDDLSDMDNTNLDTVSKCIYLIRCAFSKGFERDCPCDHDNCSLVMNDVCENDSYNYPVGRLIRPYIMYYYSLNRSWVNVEPDAFSLVGSIKCRGFYGEAKETAQLDMNDWYKLESFPLIDFLFCNNENISRDYQSPIQYHESCWNESLTWNGRPYAFFDICIESRECVSQYRIDNGYSECGSRNELPTTGEDLCSNVKKHRLQCSYQESPCLLMDCVGDRWEYCDNGYDEYVDGLGESIFEIECKKRDDDGCRFLKEYISRDVRSNITDSTSENMLRTMVLLFLSYCDTFWNLPSHLDESPQHCQEWECHDDQYQCQTGHCIELLWLCDGEWDCPDASDEEAVDLNSQRLLRNTRLPDFEQQIAKCRNRYSTEQPFAKKCNVTIEYPCLLANVTDPLYIEKHRPCINLTQIGDGVENCYGGLDEKNTLESCHGSMLGFSFRCENKKCLYQDSFCQPESEWCNNEILCYYKSKNESCSAAMDVVCLNGSCRKNARCNGKFECPHGEDEYWCPFIKTDPRTLNSYRNSKRSQKIYRQLFWPTFPSFNQSISSALDETKVVQYSRSSPAFITTTRIHTNYSDSYICNRGVAVAYNGKESVVCFCPPSYYGNWCQYFSDRLTVIIHLDLTSLSTGINTHGSRWFKIVALLLYVERVVDFYEFDVNREIEINNFVKRRFYLLYSLSDEMREQKKVRHFNRTDIIKTQPYSIRFDVYNMTDNVVNELGSWFYPIYFDFLPAFRLATVLKFPNWYGNSSSDPCANNTSCPQNSICRPSFNKTYPKFWCSCKSGFYGEHCELFEPECLSYCASNALCKPKGRGERTNTNNLLCICPLHRFGPRCNLRHEECNSQPCRNDGTCHLRSDPSGQQSFICICPKNYHGDYCEINKFLIHIDLTVSSYALASVVQFYDVHDYKLQLLIQHQQVMSGVPTSVRHSHNKDLAPRLAILKLHDLSPKPRYHILYIQSKVARINITSTPKHCPHVNSLLLTQNQTSATAVFKYHRLCQNDPQLFCFHDENYLCICDLNHSRVDCLGLNSSVDLCDLCFSGGKCLRGDLENPNDFLCLCPKCSGGRWCEFTTFAFGFTLDSLLANDPWIVRIVYTCVVALLFVIGISTNVCSLITFKLRRPRKVTVGNYLYIVSILNQFALFFLLLKFIHILGGFAGQYTLNLISCKIISYLLFVFTRATFWLISWITCDRLQLTIFPSSTWSKRPSNATRISLVTLIALGAMHIPDALYTTVAVDKCIVKFDHPFISLYNRLNTLLHYLGTFAIQTLAITILIVLVAHSRAKVTSDKTTFRQTFKVMFKTKKELYLTPIIIVLSALPHTILSFSLSCSELSVWQRHILLPAYLLSYAPQILGFILFVLPSKGYRQELQTTNIGKTSVLQWILKTANSEQIQLTTINKSNLTRAT